MKRTDVYLDLTNYSSKDLKELYNVLINEDIFYDTRVRLKSGEICTINTHLFFEEDEWIGTNLKDVLYDKERTEITLNQLKELVK